jgi:nucleoporin NUP159
VDISRATPAPSTPIRDPRLPDRVRRPVNVTPNVAATTAAALNAERGAHRLKKALLAARKEPLLNNSVNVSKPPPLGFQSPLRTPPKAEIAKTATTPGNASRFSLPSSFSGGTFDTPVKDEPDDAFALPDDDFSPSALLPGGPNSRRSVTKKHSSVQLPKRSPGTPTPAAPSFDWGPMPTFIKPPSTSLFASFRKES